MTIPSIGRGVGIAIATLCLSLAAAAAARAECGIFVAPCHEFKLAAAVFDGTIERRERFSEEKTTTSASGVISPGFTVDRVRVRVHRAWKGVAAGRVVDVLGVVEGILDEVVPLSVGERYLFYARRDGQGRLWAQACQRTRRLAEAGEDISHFESAGGALAFGVVTVRGKDNSETAAPGLAVMLNGPRGERQTRTDEKGAFAFRDLPTGSYFMTVGALPTHAVIYPPSGSHGFEIHDTRECEQAWFILRPGRK